MSVENEKSDQSEREDIVNLRVVYSIFEDNDVQESELLWFADKPLSGYLEGLPEEVNWAVSVNGHVIERDKWATTFLEKEDYLVLKLVPTGGKGGSKQIFKMVAMIALTVVASVLTAGMGAILAAVVTTAITAVGGFLLNALFPAPKPKINKNDNQGDDTPTYGADGPKNTSSEEVPVPIVLGEFRVGGNITNLHLQNDSNTQIMYGQYIVSEGEIESISDIRVNDQPVSNFQTVDYQTRMGTDTQPICDWFNDTITPYNLGVKLNTDWINYTTSQEVDKLGINLVLPGGLVSIDSKSGNRKTRSVAIEAQYKKISEDDTAWKLLGEPGWVTFTGSASDLTTRLQYTVTVTSPGGVESTAYTYTLQYRKVGDPDWIDLPAQSGVITNNISRKRLDQYREGGPGEYIYSFDPTTITKTFDLNDLAVGSYETQLVGDGVLATKRHYVTVPIVIAEATRNPVRRSFFTDQVELSAYNVRVRRTTAESESDLISDSVTLDDVNEVILDDIRYIHSAYYGLKIKFTDQLNRIPNVTALVRGVKCAHYDMEGNYLGHFWTQNPAFITVEMLTNIEWGGGIALSRLVISKFVEWAEYCTEKGLKFNGVYDQLGNLWDAMQIVLRVGHAQIVPIGTKYSIVIEREESASMMFSVANMVKDTFEITWLPIEDRANEFEVSYYDKNDGNKRKTIRVVDYEALARGAVQRSVGIDMRGVDNVEQAFKEGWLQMALNRYLLKSVSFSAPMEAISCGVGSVVFVQNDVPAWAYGGRLEADSTTTVLKLDRDVEMFAAKNYAVLVHHSALLKYSAEVLDKVGDYIYVNIGATPSKIDRLKKGSLDMEIFHKQVGSPNTGILVDDASGITIGDTVELWETDAIEERSVVLSIGTKRQITVTSPLTITPSEYSNFMFGETVKLKQKFRIREISRTHDYDRKLSLIEYNPAIYADPTIPVPAVDYSNIPVQLLPLAEVNISDNLLKGRDGTLITRVQVSWEVAFESSYEGADVWVSTDAGPYEMLGTVGGRGATFFFDAFDEEELLVKVVPFDGAKKLGLNDVEAVAYTVVGKNAKPSNVSNFAAQFIDGSIVMNWDLITDLDASGYEIREGSSWEAGATNVVVSGFKGSKFSVIKNTGGSFTFWIAAIDTSGFYSETAVNVTVAVDGPEAVRGFDCVTNNNMIIFTWLPNQAEYIPTYEIREGAAWDSSTLIAKVGGTTYAVPVNNSLVRKFWIKALNRFDVESTVATFASPIIAELPEYNIIGEFDQATTFTGKKINFDFVTDHLETTVDKVHSEYFFDVDLLASFLARSQLIMEYEAIVNSTETWADAAYAWSSSQANRQWVVRGDVSSVSLAGYIATKTVDLEAYEVESWSLSNTLTGLDGTASSEAVSVAYESGGKARFGTHSLIKDSLTEVAWVKAVPAEFHVNFWVEPVDTGTTYTLFRLVNGGNDLRVDYNSATHELSLIGSDAVTVTLGTAHGDLDGQRVFVGVTQTDAARSLYIGIYDNLYSAEATGAYAPIGTWTDVQLY